jgi:hypothetical protein
MESKRKILNRHRGGEAIRSISIVIYLLEFR